MIDAWLWPMGFFDKKLIVYHRVFVTSYLILMSTNSRNKKEMKVGAAWLIANFLFGLSLLMNNELIEPTNSKI